MPTLVFVFGTLKQGFPNAATNRGARWPGNFRTEAAFPLYLVGERHVPWLLNAPGKGLPVIGQAYLKPANTLAPQDIRLGPLAEYTLAHAALYRRRAS
jgi:gamma-glutamylaminecyclotransferase